ncbi:sigma-70 family RNA polymerase sigma factor [Brachybacterium sp. AOP43-C2-M15]|uniref:sigma-70 family RNA polymerase sigma factor n=1 Tax=Brachybacterium sp. AOP43-C2-M15 TaxID=3457661 RepID=UPI0040333B14
MSVQDLATFEDARPRLGALAYRLLGTAAEAEDAVQEAYLRWDAAERTLIENPPAWLTRVLTNLCLNQLDSARARRETSVGQWLPEPLLDGDPLLGPAETVAQRDAVSLAMLGLLEILPPRERAVFVLREAFSHSHAEIAEILGTSESGSQQALARARRHLSEGRRRRAVDPATSHAVAREFLEAAVGGDLERLVAVLAEEATSRADGGGTFPAARRPIRGGQAVATYLRGIFRRTPATSRFVAGPVEVHAADVNRAPALLVTTQGRLLGVIALELEGERVRHVRIQLDPAKLARIGADWAGREHSEPLARMW